MESQPGKAYPRSHLKDMFIFFYGGGSAAGTVYSKGSERCIYYHEGHILREPKGSLCGSQTVRENEKNMCVCV